MEEIVQDMLFEKDEAAAGDFAVRAFTKVTDAHGKVLSYTACLKNKL